MTKAVKVSVVIPSHNRRELLVAAVESCLAQNLPDTEVIIVDDGSTDGTGKMVERLRAQEWKNHNVRYLLQENSGASSARNYGLRYARGDYIQFLDSDDELLPGKLKKQVQFLDNPANADFQMCYCYGRLGETSDSSYLRIGVATVTTKELLCHLASRTVHVMQTTAPLWRKSFLMQSHGWCPDIGLGDDLEFHVRLICTGEKFGFIREELFFVREHNSQRLSVGPMSKKSLLSAVETQRKVQASLEASGFWFNDIRSAFYDKTMITYSNVLSYGENDDLEAFEFWLRTIGQEDRYFRRISAVISLRRLIGAKAIIFLHRCITKLRFPY